MKTTGMVRRIDELGRIVIPKEIRKQLMMKEGESISFFLEDDKIVLTKFSLLKKLSPIIESLLNGLYQKYHNTFLVCDLQQVLICSSNALAMYQRKKLPQDFILSLEQNKTCVEEMIEFIDGIHKVTTLPLMKEMQCVGALVMITEKTSYYMVDETILEFAKNIIEREGEECV